MSLLFTLQNSLRVFEKLKNYFFRVKKYTFPTFWAILLVQKQSTIGIFQNRIGLERESVPLIFLYGADMHLESKVSALKAVNLVEKAITFPDYREDLRMGSGVSVCCVSTLILSK